MRIACAYSANLSQNARTQGPPRQTVDLSAFLVPCFVFGSDAYIVSNSNNFFVHISHDEYWGVVARTQEIYDKLFSELG